MGLGGISIWQLLILLVIVVLIFGTKKLRNMGGDLGSAVKNFKSSMNEGENEANADVAKRSVEAKTDKQASAEQADSNKEHTSQN